MTAVDDIRFRSDMKVTLCDSMGGDSSVVRAARVSTGTDLALNPDDGDRFINFLMRDRHGTPFEHNAMTFRIEAPIFVFREFHRHRAGWSYNEESGRYKQLDPVFYLPDGERPMVQQGKPGAYHFATEDAPIRLSGSRVFLRDLYRGAYEAYTDMLALDVPREVSRMALPVGIYSSMYATCNARSLLHFLSLRTRDPRARVPSGPQYEIEQVALAMEMVFAQLFPITYRKFNEHGRVAP